MMRDEGSEITLPGCLLLRFAPGGRCEELREYWHVEEGRRDPPAGWGSDGRRGDQGARRASGARRLHVLSELLRPPGVELCDACAVSAGQEVLDVAAGDGNFALACAREGASVVAADFSPGDGRAGPGRTDAEGYDVEWRVADVEDLPFEDASFDCVGSVFGAMIAPQPARGRRGALPGGAAGGTVGMTAWTPGGVFTELFSLSGEYAPPPPGQPPSEEWGDEENVRERFDGLAAHVEIERRTLAGRPSRPRRSSPARAGRASRRPPARRCRPSSSSSARARPRAGRPQRGGDGPVRIDADYLVIVARKRG